MPVGHLTLGLLLLLALPPAACGSGTDITRTDDNVDQWVAEQRADARGSKPFAPGPRPTAPAATPCTLPWYEHVEAELKISDAEGHGPDLGTAEWKSAVEYRLGVRDKPDFPEPDTSAWCTHVDHLITAHPTAP